MALESTTVTFHGPRAEIRLGYYQAATLGPWTLTASPGGGTLTATVERADTFRLSQPALLTFQVTRQTGRPFRWPIRTLRVAGDQLSAEVGLQE